MSKAGDGHENLPNPPPAQMRGPECREVRAASKGETLPAQESGTAATERGHHPPVVLHQAEGGECGNFVSEERWQSWVKALVQHPNWAPGYTAGCRFSPQTPLTCALRPHSAVCHKQGLSEHRCIVCWNHLPPKAARQLGLKFNLPGVFRGHSNQHCLQFTWQRSSTGSCLNEWALHPV